jgi:membrane protease YdiL (CAAX protease family)
VNQMKGGGGVATRYALSAALIGAVLAGLATTAAWLYRHGGRPLLPPPLRDRFVRWGWWDVILAAAAMFVVPAVMFTALQSAGVFRWYYGADPVREKPELVKGADTDPGKSELLKRCAILWAQTLALPVMTVLVMGSVRRVSGTEPRHFGLRERRLLPGLAAGCVTWVLVTPAVFGLQYLSILIQQRAFGVGPNEHELVQLMGKQGRPAEWVLLVLQAVVFAPVWEELLFRGLLLPRLAKHEWGSHLAWGLAVVFVAPMTKTINLQSLAPLVFVLILWAAGAAATLYETGPFWRWRAILSCATLFAAVHADAWPAPVPLFVLAVALGWLAVRTRGVIAPIVLHALFNTVSTVLLLLGLA